MISKKFLTLTVAALAVAALAAPAGASALMFNYEGKGIEKSIAISMSGSLNWVTTSGRGFDCAKVTTTVDVETFDAKVTDVHIETSSCVGTGPYTACKVTGDKRTNLPWTVTPTLASLDYKTGTIDWEASCPGLISTSVSFETLTGTVDNANAIKTETVSGTGTSGLETATFSGTFEVVGEAAGKLSIVE